MECIHRHLLDELRRLGLSGGDFALSDQLGSEDLHELAFAVNDRAVSFDVDLEVCELASLVSGAGCFVEVGHLRLSVGVNEL